MADEDKMVFDPSEKKKKKKGGPTVAATTAPKAKPTATGPTSAVPLEPALDEPLDFGNKKKKPKKSALDMSEIKSELPTEISSSTTSSVPPLVMSNKDDSKPAAVEAIADDESGALNFGKKKKKKPTVAAGGEGEEAVAGVVKPTGLSDEQTLCPLSYDLLLKRVYDKMRENNPEMLSGERRRVVMAPPVLNRIGTKKTQFGNFNEISTQLKRKPQHLLDFLFAELGTTGSLDGNNQLIIKGRYQTKHIEILLRNYIKEYVMCHTCKSTDTQLSKDTRLFFLECNTCRSRCSVVSIKSGFQAVVGKRAAQRAKTNE